ncbi:MAG TPA: helix-turn-helix transcriptional regulator [Pseudonocardiaceae bacterium]|nr:helix-turn-helix transcriptional regulator [Pseudonocardiaceae bacterium]
MARSATPVVQQRRLRAELRKVREDAGITQKKVAGDLGWSLSKVIRLETGATAFQTSEVMALVHYYGITDQATVNDLLQVTRSTASSWWDEYSEYYDQQFLNFLAYEDSAATIRQFQALAIPGLLQTREYASSVFSGYAYEPERHKRAIDVRLRRQHLLDRDGGPIMSFILDEAVILRWVGDAEVMRNQLIRLKEINDLGDDSIGIRVVPFTAGVNMSMKGSFTIFEYDSDDEDYIIDVEEPRNDVLIRDNPETSSNYVEAFLALEDIALPKTDSTKLISAAIKQIGGS